LLRDEVVPGRHGLYNLRGVGVHLLSEEEALND
jgi:hypothetical protein